MSDKFSSKPKCNDISDRDTIMVRVRRERVRGVKNDDNDTTRKEKKKEKIIKKMRKKNSTNFIDDQRFIDNYK